MKVLAFGASSSKNSINQTLALYAANMLKAINSGVEIETLDLNDYEMPIYSEDREENGIPDQAKAFFEKVRSADAIIISFAEHNGSYTAAYKNIFDWASRIEPDVYKDKQMVTLSASPGEYGGITVLDTFAKSAPYFGMDIKASLQVGGFGDVFDVKSGDFKDEDMKAKLRGALENLK